MPLGGHSISDAAKRLGIARKTLTIWIRDGKVKVNRISPRIIRVPEKEIRKIEEQTR